MEGVFALFAGAQHRVSNHIIVVKGDKASMRAMFHNPVSMAYVPWPKPFFTVGRDF